MQNSESTQGALTGGGTASWCLFFGVFCFLPGDAPMANQAVMGERWRRKTGPEDVNNHGRASTEPNDFAHGKKKMG